MDEEMLLDNVFLRSAATERHLIEYGQNDADINNSQPCSQQDSGIDDSKPPLVRGMLGFIQCKKLLLLFLLL